MHLLLNHYSHHHSLSYSLLLGPPGPAGRYGAPSSPSKMGPGATGGASGGQSPRGQTAGYGTGRGNVLGRGEEDEEGGEEGKDGVRQQLHSKWEADKKTQKRYSFLSYLSLFLCHYIYHMCRLDHILSTFAILHVLLIFSSFRL